MKGRLWVCTPCLVFLLAGCQTVTDSESTVHVDTINEAAITYGAQSGLAWKAARINETLEKHSKELDGIYDFNALALKDNLMPPVIDQSFDSVNSSDYDTMRSAEREIKIVKPAGLVTAAPTWRNYLMMSYKKPTKLNPSLYPTTVDERKVWEDGLLQGWVQGVEQAQDMFEESLGVLNRDFKGMILYHRLLLQNMVSSPFSSTASMGVTGDESMMRINDKVTRITAQAELNAKRVEQWQPVIEINGSAHG